MTKTFGRKSPIITKINTKLQLITLLDTNEMKIEEQK